MVKKRIISIAMCALMLGAELPSSAYAAADYGNINFVSPLAEPLPEVGENGFIKGLTGELPEPGRDGFIEALEEPLPVHDSNIEGFLREPDEPLPEVTEGEFLIVPSEDLPVPGADGFVNTPEVPLPVAGENGFVGQLSSELPIAGDSGFIAEYEGTVFTGKETGFLKPITAPDPSATVISTAAELASMTSGSYVLANDIYLDSYNGGEWRPVEPQGDIVFDGQGHKIYNMSATSATYDNCALFINRNYMSGNIPYNLTVKNVGFENPGGSTIGNDSYLGAAVVYQFTGNELVISNCYNTATVIGGGGLVSLASGESVIITDCYNTGAVKGGYGGIIGDFQGGTLSVSGCFNTGAVSDRSETGGIVGIAHLQTDSEQRVEIINCANFGKITASEIAGGIIGSFERNVYKNYATSLTVKNCSNKGNISAPESSAGIAAYCYIDSLDVSNCFNTGMVTSSNSANLIYSGGIVGYAKSVVSISQCYNKGRIILTCSDKENTSTSTYCCAAGILAYCGSTAAVTDCFNSGIVTGTAHYGLYTGGIIGYGDSTVSRAYNTAKITANDIGTITVTPSRFYAAGIIAYGKNTVVDSYNTGTVDSYELAAGIASYANFGTYANCYNEGIVKGQNGAGIGTLPAYYNLQEGEPMPEAVFTKCRNGGSIETTAMAAGIVYSDSVSNIKALQCINEGAVASLSSAGIIKLDLLETDEKEVFEAISCLNTGAVTGEYESGGILSEEPVYAYDETQYTYITDCMNSGTVTWGSGLASCGIGVIRNSFNTGEIIYGSGLFSSMYGAVYDSYNSAPVTGGSGLGYGLKSAKEVFETIDHTPEYTDDINGDLINCFNTGKITGTAGLLMNAGSLNVRNCYNTGDIDTTDAFSGTAGLIYTVDAAGSFYMEDCFNSGNMTSQAYMFDKEAIGGVVGYCGVAESAYFNNCYNTGSISHTDSGWIGGVVGAISVSSYNDFYNETITSARIYNCYNTGDITATGSNHTIGGILGLNHDISASGTIVSCASLGDITFNAGTAAGIAGDCDMDALNCVSSGAIKCAAQDDNTIVVGIFSRGGNITSCLLDNADNVYTHAVLALTCGNIDNCYFRAEGSYHSGALAQECGNITDSYYMGNITLWGDGETFGGLVGKAGTVKNSFFIGNIIFDITVGGYLYLGGIAGQCTDISESTYRGDIRLTLGNENEYIKFGGLAGKADTVARCRSYGSGYLDGYFALAGGLAGEAAGVSNSISDFSIEMYSVSDDYYQDSQNSGTAGAGGIVASGATAVYNCVSNGDIISNIRSGGIAAYSDSVDISSCINNGNIEILQSSTSRTYHTGGIIAYAKAANVRDCINSGKIIADSGSSIAGIAGYILDGNILRCINNGDLSGGSSCGIVHIIYSQSADDNNNGYGDVKDCINYGNISSDSGSAMGIGPGDVYNCVNNGDITSDNALGIADKNVIACVNNGAVTGGIVYGITSSDAADCINTGDINIRYVSDGETEDILYTTKSSAAIADNAQRCVNTGITNIENSYVSNVCYYGIAADTATDCYNSGNITVSNNVTSNHLKLSAISAYATNCVSDAAITVESLTYTSVYGVAVYDAVNCINNKDITVNINPLSDDTSLFVSIYGICGNEANSCTNYGNITLTCAASGSTDIVMGVADSASFCDNYGEISVNTGNNVEAVGVGNMATESRNHADVSAVGNKVYVGGVGYCNATVSSNSGDVYGEGSYVYAGGLAAYNNVNIGRTYTIANSVNTGSITAVASEKAYAGGLMGYGRGAFVNSTNKGRVTANLVNYADEAQPEACAGGIVGFASGSVESWFGTDADSERMVIENCSNTAAVRADVSINGVRTIGRSYAGGLIGTMYKSEIGMNYGTPIYSYTLFFVDDASCNLGTVYSNAENTGGDANSYVSEYSGDIYGYGKIYSGEFAYPETIYITGKNILEVDKTCTLTAVLSPNDSFFDSVTWASTDTSVAKVESNGDLTATLTAVAKGRATITATTENGIVAEHLIEVMDNKITVVVHGYERFKESEAYPLEGASVTIGTVTAVTDAEGKAVFERGELPSGSTARLFITAGEDYKEEETVIGLIPSSYSVNHNYYLRKRDYVIVVDSASIEIDNMTHKLVGAPGMKYIPALETDGTPSEDIYPFDVKIDWGKYDENVADRKVWLESASAKVQIKEGSNNVAFAKYFPVKEAIKVVATTKDSSGKEVRGEYTLPLKTQIINVNLKPDSSESFDLSSLYFLEGLDLKLSLDNLSKVADIELKDGMLKLEFGRQSKSDNKPLELGIFENKTNTNVGVTGFVSIPVSNIKTGEWEGGVKVTAGVESGNSTNTDKKYRGVTMFKHKHDFKIGGVPVFLDLELKGAGTGSLSVFGPFGEAYFRGKLEGEAQAEIFGGLGGELNDDCQLKFGPSGDVTATVPLTFEARSLEDTSMTFDPSVTGKVDLQVMVKLFDLVDLKEELDLGHFRLDKNGFVTSKDEEALLAELSNIDFANARVKVLGRDYMKNGGGFSGDDAVLLMSDDGSRVINTVYENIIKCADTALTVFDGKPCLIFTEDNPERDTYNALNAVYSIYNNGVWSEPQALSDDGTNDSTISADGSFVIWENTNSLITSENTLSEALALTDISVAVWDGEKFVTNTLTNDGVYDFGAKIKEYNGKAVAAWLSNSENDCTSLTGTTSVCYSIYDGDWSEVKRLDNVSGVTNVNVLYDEKGAYVIYKDASLGLQRINAETGEADVYVDNVGRYAAADIESGTLLADIDSDCTLNIYQDGQLVKSVQTDYNGSANPVIGVNGQYANIFWTENDGIYYVTNTDGEWIDKLCFKEDMASVSDVDCIVGADGEFILTYMHTVNDRTDLVTVNAAPGADLIVDEISYDSDSYISENIFDYSITMRNNGDKAVSGCSVYLYDGDSQISVIDFNDEVILPGESTTLYGSCALDENAKSLKHTYRLEATCDGDFDTSNNYLDIDVGTVDAELADATFEVNDVGEESLKIRVRNNGNVNIEGTTVNVYKNSQDSEPVYTFATGAINAGETGEFSIPETQDKDAVYYVTVFAAGDEDSGNDMDCIAYERIVQDSPITYELGTGKVTAVTDSASIGESGKVIAALYGSDGILKKLAAEDVVSGQEEYSFDMPGMAVGDIIKIMVWDDLTVIRPKIPVVYRIVE
ncbi:MAG: Ig-like domain-containing protein [Clostridia bacterium]|nr:Ig-like domain-containing protein [Clostridia bacterium]